MPAALEELVGGLAVPGRALRQLGEELTMEQLSERSHRDAKAAALIDDILSEVALWIVNVATVVDPARVVIGGGFLRAPSDICGRIQALFEKVSAFPPEVLPAHW
jgi:glucokinase